MNNLPIISIITVVYNARDALDKTLKSVASQNYPHIESIIIDGGSKDGTTDVILRYQNIVKYWISEPDKGIYDAMNKGLSKANGNYVTFLNAGDLYYSDDVLQTLFQTYNEQDIIYGDIYIVSGNMNNQQYLKALKFEKSTLISQGTRVVCHQAIFVKRTKAPLYNTAYKYKAELNWYFDIIEKKPGLTYLHKQIPVVNYYLGGAGYKNFWQNLFEWVFLVYKRFGIKTFIKSKVYLKVWEKIKYHYAEILKKAKY